MDENKISEQISQLIKEQRTTNSLLKWLLFAALIVVASIIIAYVG